MPTTRPRSLYPTVIRCLSLLPFLLTFVDAQLAPLGTPLQAYASVGVDQMTYDHINKTLYMANPGRSTVVQVSQVNTAPLAPLNTTPWAYAIVAGVGGAVSHPAPDAELHPTVASMSPIGVVGWPWYAVGPFSHADAPRAGVWVGLWVADYQNNAIRFINFLRGRNVTLVAGSGASGARDGIGTAASLNYSSHVAWGRFLRSTAADGNVSDESAGWTTAVFWCEQLNNCVRQGIPLRNDKSESPLDASSLRYMVLNVTSFAGRCEFGNVGTLTGLAYNRAGMFWRVYGIALAVPVPSNKTAAVLFIGDNVNRRLLMTSPMYPSSARFVTVVATDPTNAVLGIAVGRIRVFHVNVGAVVVTLDIATAAYPSSVYRNVSVVLTYNVSNGNTTLISASNGAMNTLATTEIWHAYSIAFVRYTPNSSYNGSLVLFSGYSNANLTDVFQFYCCLGPGYSDPLELQDRGGPLLGRATRSSSSSVLTIYVTRSSESSSASQSRSKSYSVQSESWTSVSITASTTVKASQSAVSGSMSPSLPSTVTATSSMTFSRSGSKFSPSVDVTLTATVLPTLSASVAVARSTSSSDTLVAVTSTSTVLLSGVAFAGTTPVMGLQRINSLLAVLNCIILDPSHRPSLVANPSQASLDRKLVPRRAQIPKNGGGGEIGWMLSGYWRMTWVWVLLEGLIAFGVGIAVSLGTS